MWFISISVLDLPVFPFQFPVCVSPSFVDPPDIPTISSTMVRLGWTKIQEVHGNVHANLSLVLFSVLARIWKVGIKMCYRLRSSDMFVSTGCQDTHLSKILVQNIIKTYLKKPPSWSLLILHLKPQGINRTLQSSKIECLSCPVRFVMLCWLVWSFNRKKLQWFTISLSVYFGWTTVCNNAGGKCYITWLSRRSRFICHTSSSTVCLIMLALWLFRK